MLTTGSPILWCYRACQCAIHCTTSTSNCRSTKHERCHGCSDCSRVSTLYMRTHTHVQHANTTCSNDLTLSRKQLMMASKSSSKKRPCLSCGKLCTARCAQCKAVNFCSRACQVKCWPEHRATCKPNKAKTAASTSTASTPTAKRLASSTSSSAPAPPGPSPETARRLRILNRMRRAVDDHMRGAGMSTRDSPNRLFQVCRLGRRSCHSAPSPAFPFLSPTDAAQACNL